MGRPAFSPTDQQRAQVIGWVQARVPIEGMARRMGLAPKTFRKHFAAELGLIAADQVATAMPPGTPVATVGAFRPTDEQREWVIMLSGCHWPHRDIAAQLQVSEEVLEEHFAEELAMGPVKFPAEVIRATWYAARGGNQAAATKCLVMNGRGPTGADARPAAVPQPAAEGLQGKKQMATIGARNAEQNTPWDKIVN